MPLFGFWTGVVTTIVIQISIIYLVFQYLRAPKSIRQPAAPSEPLDKQPVNAAGVDFLKLGKIGSSESSKDFLNLMIHRLFLTYQKSAMFRRYYGEKLTKKFNSKLTGNTYIKSLAILDVILGDRPPSIASIQTKVSDNIIMVLVF